MNYVLNSPLAIAALNQLAIDSMVDLGISRGQPSQKSPFRTESIANQKAFTLIVVLFPMSLSAASIDNSLSFVKDKGDWNG